MKEETLKQERTKMERVKYGLIQWAPFEFLQECLTDKAKIMILCDVDLNVCTIYV